MAWEEAEWRHHNGAVADYFVVCETYDYSPQVVAAFLAKEDAEAYVTRENERNERPASSDHLCVMTARINDKGVLMLWNSYEDVPGDGP